MASIDGKRRFQVLFRGSESGFMGAINGFVVGAPMKQLHGTAIGFGPLQDAGGALILRIGILNRVGAVIRNDECSVLQLLRPTSSGFGEIGPSPHLLHLVGFTTALKARAAPLAQRPKFNVLPSNRAGNGGSISFSPALSQRVQ